MSAPSPYITTHQSIAGWNAMHVWWNPDLGGFWEPCDVRRVQSADEGPAIVAALQWAAETGLPYKPRAQT